MFARILTYFYLLMIAVFIFISLFLHDIVTSPLFFGKPIISEPYWSGLSIVPIVLLGYVFLGISNNLVAGIYIEKKTKHLPAITFVGLAVNVGVNYMLIPVMGIMGAAIATLLSYSVMAVVLFIVVQRFYPVRYEFVRLAKITVSAVIVMGLYAAVPPPLPSLMWKAILLALFVVTMYGMRFLESSELRVLIQLFRLRSSPGESDIPR
jgi:O-antigen/teichoic acid export membrane protein